MKTKKYSVCIGGGATFYLIDAKTGKGLNISAENKEKANVKAQKLLDDGLADWALSDDPEPEGDLIVDRLDDTP